MKKDTIIEAAAPVEPVDVLPLAELAGEGFGWGGAFVKTPKDAVDALAAELVGMGAEILFDDIGRRCVSRDTARRLLAERADAEARAAEIRRRQDEKFAQPREPVLAGVPAIEGLDGVQAMLAADGGDERRKDRTADRTWRLMRGESWGGTYGPSAEEES